MGEGAQFRAPETGFQNRKGLPTVQSSLRISWVGSRSFKYSRYSSSSPCDLIILPSPLLLLLPLLYSFLLLLFAFWFFCWLPFFCVFGPLEATVREQDATAAKKSRMSFVLHRHRNQSTNMQLPPTPSSLSLLLHSVPCPRPFTIEMDMQWPLSSITVSFPAGREEGKWKIDQWKQKRTKIKLEFSSILC